MKYLILISALALVLVACRKDDPAQGEIRFVAPSNLPAPTYDFAANPVTREGFELGRKLFYDPILSRDSSIACADCHISFSAFSHPAHVTSHGIDGLFGRRNALPMQNLAWSPNFFWDGGVAYLDFVPLNAIQSEVEMDESPARVVAKLQRHPQYPGLFRAAFPASDTVSGVSMLQALSQFMALLVSAESRYDHYVRQEKGGDLNADELAGLALFKAKCATCHATDLFTDHSFRNNGILADFSLDQGRAEVSTFPEDVGKFKVPSLRNVALTAPYMHNGKFSSLAKVLAHYASGVKDSPTLDPLLKQNGQLGIPLTATEQAQLIDFLHTLTDEGFVKDVRFQKAD
jgi:cytochrome c peroxidase